jgi:hypothetical protein
MLPVPHTIDFPVTGEHATDIKSATTISGSNARTKDE